MSGDGTVGKALDVLDQVAAYGQPVRFATLLAESKFPKATLYRFLQTLTSQGMLEYDPDRQTYALGVRLVRLAHAAWMERAQKGILDADHGRAGGLRHGLPASGIGGMAPDEDRIVWPRFADHSLDARKLENAPDARLREKARVKVIRAPGSLAPRARPVLDQLSAETGQTVHLAQLDNAQVLYVDKRNAAQPVEMFSDAGKVGPAYCTGVGKAMLAFLPEEHLARVIAQQSFHRFTEHTYTTPEALCAELAAIRTRGYAFDREEHEPGIICIAHPILTGTGRVLGAMSITGALQATDLKQLESWAPRLARTADAIAQEAQTWRFPDTHLQHTGT